MICAGYSSSRKGVACKVRVFYLYFTIENKNDRNKNLYEKGDAGDPLHCKVGNYWRLVGLTSFGRQNCEANVVAFTRVTITFLISNLFI